MSTSKTKKPVITIDQALQSYEGNQSALARALGVDRSLIGKWKTRNDGFLPELYAWRFANLHPNVVMYR